MQTQALDDISDASLSKRDKKLQSTKFEIDRSEASTLLNTDSAKLKQKNLEGSIGVSSSSSGHSSNDVKLKESKFQATAGIPRNEGENLYQVWMSRLKIIWRFLRREVFAPPPAMSSKSKQEVVRHFFIVPLELEKTIALGCLFCLDNLLTLSILIPLRFVFGLFARGPRPYKDQDILKGALMGVSCYILFFVNPSKLYHLVRGQSVVKLYVIYNVLEVFNRLYSAFGQDVIDTLLDSPSLGSMMTSFLIAVAYLVGHTLLLFYQLIALNVAINSHTYALLPLLLSNQFYEVKSSVFKRFEKENLFQLVCGDAVERFELTTLLFIIAARNISELLQMSPWKSLLYYVLLSILIVLLSECFADWIKHTFVAKFNRISPGLYTVFRELLYQDMRSAENVPLVYRSERATRRMGCFPYALICLLIRSFLRFAQGTSFLSMISFVGLCLLGACLLKCLTSSLLVYICYRRPCLVEKEYDLSALLGIDRYTLFKNRIP